MTQRTFKSDLMLIRRRWWTIRDKRGATIMALFAAVVLSGLLGIGIGSF